MGGGPIEDVRASERAIAVRATDAMYEDPFWMERFGARGRRHSENDASYHLGYVIQAMHAEDAGVIERYAEWLQGLLLPRGMCTLHLSDNFAAMSLAIRDIVPTAPAAARYLDAARSALLHREPKARAFMQVEAEIAADVVVALGHLPRSREQIAHEVAHHLSYLGDALALDSVTQLASYSGFMRDFLARRGVGSSALRTTLDAIDARIAGDRALDAAVIDAARKALASAAQAMAAAKVA